MPFILQCRSKVSQFYVACLQFFNKSCVSPLRIGYVGNIIAFITTWQYT